MERIGREVERELTRRSGNQGAPVAAIAGAWVEVVGDAISRQAWPLRVSRDGTLHVATSSATWAHELGFHADEILGRLREHLGSAAPTGMRCAPGPIPEPEAPEGTPERGLPAELDVPPEVREEAAAVASAIDDPELRELVSRAARASLLRARSGRNF